LSEERRQELSKVAARCAEEAKIAIRNVRRDAIDSVKQMEKKHEVGEDEMRKLLDEIQNVTDEYSEQIKVCLTKKQNDVMNI
jgi:ribosome recycling factor